MTGLPAPALIVLLTDFGLADPYVGILKGVILGICPTARLIDLGHAVPAGDIRWGAWQLWSARRYFPAGTIFLAVVDPGVGGTRLPVAVSAGGQLFVGPDNGLLSWAAEQPEQIVRLDQPRWHLPAVSQTFHGRDIFAPVAAHLASGAPLSELGSGLAALTRLERPLPARTDEGLSGEVLLWDRFGNLITNLTARDLENLNSPVANLQIIVGNCLIEGLSGTYSDTLPAAPLALIGSSGLLEISVRDGDARQKLSAGLGTRVFVRAP